MTAFYKKLLKGNKEKSEQIQPNQAAPDVSTQLKKIQDQLVYLERKVDQLLAGSQGGRNHSRSRFSHRGNNHFNNREGRPRRFDNTRGGENREDRQDFMNKGNRNFPA